MEGLTLGLVTATVLMGILGRSVHVGAERDPMSPPFMERSPDSIAMPLHDMTTLICKMNIPTENFTWRHYPLVDPTRPNATLNLANAVYKEVPSKYIRSDNLTTEVQITLDSESKAGDYQCLARYGASVVASIPGRITKSVLEKFPPQNNTVITVSPGNTVIWWCELPYSNPPPFVDYYKDGSYVLPRHNLQSLTQSLIIPDVTEKDSGIYKCRVGNSLSGSKQESKASLILNVVRNGWKEETRFVREPRKTYTVVKGQTALLECPLVGNPVPTIKWSKHNGNLPEDRVQNKYNSLKITNVTSSDEGVYICLYNNKDFKITLLINEAPIIIEGPENRDVHEGEDLDLECTVRGTPEPIVSWILNGNSVTNDSSIEAVGNRLYFRPVGKNHAGILQCFASNEIATVYRSAYLKVIPKQRSSTDFDGIPTPITNGHARKPKKPRKPHRGGKGRTAQMIPPDRPTISRLNDEAVVVRWSVPPNQGLPIQFFKVQYRELGAVNETHSRGKGSKWMTTNADIPPHIFSYEVSDLKPNYYYKFRIAAVYSNNDNKISPHSQKFLLDRQDFFLRNPLPVPKLTHTEPINSTAIKIYWELTPVSNITLDGFYINYMLSSNAGDFTRATVEGESTRSYVINHLQPDTMYDIKLQSFTTNSASEFSGILKQKTMKDLSVESSTRTPSAKSPPADDASALYIYIATGVIGVLLVASLAVLLVVCRKWKKKKNADNRGDDKPAVDDGHHIQADAGDYVVNSKSLSRTNGCIPANRMNITANPLADADNKNQNMIEMSCLSSQNNNCSQPSASTQESLPCDSLKSKKNRDKSKRSKNSGLPPSENYV